MKQADGGRSNKHVSLRRGSLHFDRNFKKDDGKIQEAFKAEGIVQNLMEQTQRSTL